jgi:II/X family phage/plasmid replication protein
LGSHNKKIVVRISDNSRYKLGLHIEFSIPKYAKGNNVEMIYPHNLEKILEGFYSEISTVINYPLPHFSTWPLYRLDICYNWIFENLAEATSAMSFIQRIDYPRKQKYVYGSSVMHKGSAYTVKFYLKGPEFRKHDLKEIAETSPQKASELQDWANKTLRFEVEFRKTFLESLCGYKPVYLEHIISDSFIEDTLNYYLKDKVFRYLTPRNSTEAQVEEILYSNFSPTKATRLYQFYKDFFVEDGAIKRRIKTGGIHRSTIFRYKKDLKNLGGIFQLRKIFGETKRNALLTI